MASSTPSWAPHRHRPAPTAVDLDFSGLPTSLGRASPLSNRTRPMSRSSLDDDSIISAGSSFADVTTPAASSAGESDSDMPIALPPARRRTAAQPAKRRPLAAVAPLTPLRTSTPRVSRVAQAPLQPMRASTRSAVSTASIARTYRDVGVATEPWVRPEQVLHAVSPVPLVKRNAPVAACREGSEVPVSTTFNVNTGPVPASVRNGTGTAAAPAPAPAAVASVKNGKRMAAAPASDNEDVPTSPVDTDNESAYWSPDDSGKPWNYGFGDGYVSEHGDETGRWYVVTKGFKVGVFNDSNHVNQMVKRCKGASSRKADSRTEAHAAFLRAVERGGVEVVAR